jgi:hypothetical protein
MAAILLILCAVVGLAFADMPVGKGYPATPWRLEGPNSAREIEKAKESAATYQTLSVPRKIVDKKVKNGNDVIRLWRVALVATPDREGDVPSYELSGTSSSGKAVKVSFSQIESFSVTSKSDKTLTVSVKVWPDISAKDLLSTQPTYKELRAGYRREIVLEMSLRSTDGRPLAFKNGWIIPLADFLVGTKGDFYAEDPNMAHPRRFWWAIPSVANDEEYPFRIIPKR